MKTSFVLLYVAFISLFAEGQTKCNQNVDVSIIIEIPQDDRRSASRHLVSFFRDIIYRKRDCLNFAATLVDGAIKTVLDFKCNDLKCKTAAFRQVSGMMNSEDAASSSSTKSNIISVLKNLESDGVFRPDGGSKSDSMKVVLLILSSKPDSNNPISDFTKSVLENQYKIIAVGIGKGREENLYRITFERNRILNLGDFSQLSRSSKINKFQPLMQLLKNPDYRDPSKPSLDGVDVGFSVSNVGNAIEEYITEEEKCSYAVDIAFVVDSSFSIKLDYDKELLFVQRVANRFGISETGTHAGMVVFSDAKNYTKVTIRMNDFLDTKSFNNAVQDSPYIGYRTRIDYAFEKVEKELFTVEGGARPNMKKIIFLITDGYQNPVKDTKTNVPYDPVKASQLLYDDGIKIFVVGIGKDLNRGQLEDIARDKTKVFYANTIDQLISDDFVKNVSKKLCSGGRLPNITTSTPPTCNETIPIKPPCGGVGKCGSCCGSHDVYINIFQPNSGVSYIMQGMQVTQTGQGKLSGTKETGMKPNLNIGGNGKQPSGKEIMDLIKTLLPSDPNLKNKLAELLQSNIVYDVGNAGTPGIASDAQSKGKSRTRRSVGELEEFEKQRGYDLITVAKLAGCNLFFDTLDKYGMLEDVINLFTTKKLTVFCPIDTAFEEVKLSTGLSIDEKNLLLNHLAFMSPENKNLYQPMLKKGRITLTKRQNKIGRSSWFANDVKVLFSMGNAAFGQVIVISHFLKPSLVHLQEVLKSNKNVSIFYDIWKKSSMPGLFKTDRIKSICFTSNQCVSLSTEMQYHVQSVLNFKQFTVLVPSNSMMLNMEKSDLKSLSTNKIQQREFLQEHIYLGIINKHSRTNEISHSLSSKHSLLTVGSHNNSMVVVYANQKAYKVIKSFSIAEGIAHIIDEI